MFRVVVADRGDGPVCRAGAMLAELLARRESCRVPVTRGLAPEDGRQELILGTREGVRGLLPQLRPLPPKRVAGAVAAEGFTVQRLRESEGLVVAGNDERGVLFGAGWLLRACELEEGRLVLPPGVSRAQAPRMPVRGIQLGYRPVNNTIATWDLRRFERYLRELIVFGCNTVELTPPVEGPASADAGPDDWTMNLRIAELVGSYGLAVSLWLPVTEANPATAAGRATLLANRRALLQAMPRVDDIFVPGGDPGHTPPEVLLPFLAELAGLLTECHPGAGLWVSHQGFEPEARDRFYAWLRRERPDWLRGVVYGPWTRDSLEATRDAIPDEYPIRAYPDMTHSCRCQYPVPEWDRAYAFIEGREVCNPRPLGHRAIFEQVRGLCEGFVCYSDGNHDDLNKALWLALGWDPTVSSRSVLEHYARAYVGHDSLAAVREGFEGLERNWEGPVWHNRSIGPTLELWERLRAEYPRNWRTSLHAFRALCDRWAQLRARSELDGESRALAALRGGVEGSLPLGEAIERARRRLSPPPTSGMRAVRRELLALGRELRRTVELKMSVALGGRSERGDVLDHLDDPVSNAPWLLARLDEAQALAGEDRRDAIAALVGWEDPGEGGFYDDLGDPARRPHLLDADAWHGDPDCLRHPFSDFRYARGPLPERLAWLSPATTLYETPLRMRYEGLEPGRSYRLRVVYAGRFRATVTLTANGFPVHGPLPPPEPTRPLEFDLPPEATAEGSLLLEWRRAGTQWRGPQVAEVWLLRD